jgi:excisionase family DNA binding protein
VQGIFFTLIVINFEEKTTMEQDVTLKEFLREILEPIIDECLERAMNKYINSTALEPKDESGIFDMKEAAQYLKISKQTLYGMTSKRALSHYKHGHRVYFKKAELDEWINKGKVKTQAEIEADASTYLTRRSR